MKSEVRQMLVLIVLVVAIALSGRVLIPILSSTADALSASFGQWLEE